MKLCELYKIEKGKIRCLACSQNCLISEGNAGICGVRKNIKNKLYLLVYGKLASLNIDPIEKKPLYHFLPKTMTFSIGTLGCNFKCDFCQNFEISQASKGKKGENFIEELGEEISPDEIVRKAIETKCPSISYTYNEPAVFIEFVRDVAKIAKKKGLKNILVTNGYFSKESFDFIKSYIDAMNIDLKSFSERFYSKHCGGKLGLVLETIKNAHEAGIHIELTTLVIPGLNDSEKELEQIAKFIASIDKNIPWHISRFFPMYKMLSKNITPIETLKKAEAIGKKYLKFVHIGNV